MAGGNITSLMIIALCLRGWDAVMNDIKTKITTQTYTNTKERLTTIKNELGNYREKKDK